MSGSMIANPELPKPLKWHGGKLGNWTRHEFDLPNNSAGGGKKRRMTEVLWCNF